MSNPLQYRCIGCREKVVKHEDGVLRICRECWGKFTVAERAARIEAMEQTELLRDIRELLNVDQRNEQNEINQLGSLAKSNENSVRALRELLEKAGEFFSQGKWTFRTVREAIEEEKRDRGDDEPWRESLRDE